MESQTFSYLKGMKTLLLWFCSIYSIIGYGQVKSDNCPNQLVFKGWGSSYGYNLKLFDVGYRHSFNSQFANNIEGIVYPVSFFKDDQPKIDFGIGGGISTNQQSSYGYGKLYIAKDFSKKAIPTYDIGAAGYADFILGNKSQRFGIDIVNTFRISYRSKMKVIFGTSYETSENKWSLNAGLTIGIEKHRKPVIMHRKPVLYAYSFDSLPLQIKLNYRGDLTFVYPEFESYWDITACPDGNIVDNKTNRKYPYLFWEGEYEESYLSDIPKGFVVSKNDMISFFEEKLSLIGLNEKETTDFITFWVPILQEENYIIKFYQQSACDELATYDLTVTPDTFLRLYVTFQPVAGLVQIEEQTLQPVERKGFTLVEWGGMEISPKI